MEWKQDSAQTRNKTNPTDDRIVRTSGGQREEAMPTILLGSMYGHDNAHMGEGNMVECLNKATRRLVGLGKNSGPGFDSMGIEKWTQSILDSVFGAHEDTMWAPRTEQRYRAIARSFIRWHYEKRGRGTKKKTTEETKFIAPNIGEYLDVIASHRSGENINMIGGVLERLFKPHLADNYRNALKIHIKKLRRKANQINPPIQKASEALRLEDLRYMIESPEYLLLGQFERQSVDILLIAFATLSRVAEIAALSTRDVSDDGHYISIRIKHRQSHANATLSGYQMRWVYTHLEFCANGGKRPS